MAKIALASLEDARAALARGKDFDAFLAEIGQRDRTNIERHLAVIDAGPDPAHGKLWRKLAGSLAGLASLSVQTTGQQAVQFFIADGKYRMQVFALEDQRDGILRLYAPDATTDALRTKLITKSDTPAPDSTRPTFRFTSASTPGLIIELLEAKNTTNPSPFFTNLIGWNRKAVRISVPVGTSDGAVESVLALSAFGALALAGKAAPAVPKPLRPDTTTPAPK